MTLQKRHMNGTPANTSRHWKRKGWNMTQTSTKAWTLIKAQERCLLWMQTGEQRTERQILLRAQGTMLRILWAAIAEKNMKKNVYTYTRVCTGLLGSSESKESACNAGDLGSIPGLGRSPGEGNGYPLQYSCLENPIWTEEPVYVCMYNWVPLL